MSHAIIARLESILKQLKGEGAELTPVTVDVSSVTATDVTIKDATVGTQKLAINASGAASVSLTGSYVTRADNTTGTVLAGATYETSIIDLGTQNTNISAAIRKADANPLQDTSLEVHFYQNSDGTGRTVKIELDSGAVADLKGETVAYGRYCKVKVVNGGSSAHFWDLFRISRGVI